jgi:hypothetical protein
MAGEARAFEVLFPKRHISTVLNSILQAGENLRKKTANDLEDWISRRLYWRLIRIYPFMKTGAMLGYVYDRDIDKAHSGVAGYIKSRGKELKITSPKQLTRASILPDKAIYETRHRLKKSSFLIYHIFLAV